jgi:hypothetical protein
MRTPAGTTLSGSAAAAIGSILTAATILIGAGATAGALPPRPMPRPSGREPGTQATALLAQRLLRVRRWTGDRLSWLGQIGLGGGHITGGFQLASINRSSASSKHGLRNHETSPESYGRKVLACDKVVGKIT